MERVISECLYQVWHEDYVGGNDGHEVVYVEFACFAEGELQNAGALAACGGSVEEYSGENEEEFHTDESGLHCADAVVVVPQANLKHYDEP